MINCVLGDYNTNSYIKQQYIKVKPQILNTFSTFCELPRWLSDKESTCQYRKHRRPGFDPWVGRNPWRRKWQPTSVFLPGQSHGQRNLAVYSPWGCKESNMTEHACTFCNAGNYARWVNKMEIYVNFEWTVCVPTNFRGWWNCSFVLPLKFLLNLFCLFFPLLWVCVAFFFEYIWSIFALQYCVSFCCTTCWELS